MTINELKALIEKGNREESDSLEFKSTMASLPGACRTLCAFLNGCGGTVLIGVKDNGDIRGQSVTDSTRLEIANMLAKFEPHANIDIEYINVDDRYVVKFIAKPYPQSGPYVFDGKPYERVESSTKLMSQQRYQQLLLDASNHARPWDHETLENFFYR